jgi:hypothetical protein
MIASKSSFRLLTGLGYLGLAISIYALYVEYRHEIDGDDFVALCDLSATVSCTRVRPARRDTTSSLLPTSFLVQVLTNKDARLLRILFDVPSDSVFNLPNAAIGSLRSKTNVSRLQSPLTLFLSFQRCSILPCSNILRSRAG